MVWDGILRFDSSTNLAFMTAGGAACEDCCDAGIPCSFCTGSTPAAFDVTPSGIVDCAGCLVWSSAECSGDIDYITIADSVADLINGEIFSLTQTSACNWSGSISVPFVTFKAYEDLTNCNADTNEICVGEFGFNQITLTVTKFATSTRFRFLSNADGDQIMGQFTQACSVGECVDDCSGSFSGAGCGGGLNFLVNCTGASAVIT